MYALILAGGRGERLRPITDTRPKPMAEVCGKPILHHQVLWLRHHGVSDIVFLVSYKWEVVKEYFGDGSAFGVRAHYSVEETPLGRGGGLRQGLALVPQSERLVLATNGDVVCPADLSAMVKLHQSKKAMATVMLTALRSPYGIVEIDGDQMVTGFREKPELPHWINAGVYVLERSIEPLLPPRGDHEDTTFPQLAAQRKLAGFPIRVPWKSVDSHKDLREAEPVALALAKAIGAAS